ncbi:MAG TPA: Gfo/Idh/MocA family oxidoreductase [Burkholderiales bacterium]|nr:Gfo/Idh/MocA family oxidoreductase [Burkholderiales bacterium]
MAAFLRKLGNDPKTSSCRSRRRAHHRRLGEGVARSGDQQSTRNEQSARQAAEAFGADRWFSDPFATISDDGIDVITISVKVPAHRELVLAALHAGKAVYCGAEASYDSGGGSAPFASTP